MQGWHDDLAKKQASKLPMQASTMQTSKKASKQAKTQANKPTLHPHPHPRLLLTPTPTPTSNAYTHTHSYCSHPHLHHTHTYCSHAHPHPHRASKQTSKKASYVCSICAVNCNSSANLLAHSGSQKHHESVKIALRGATLLANHFKNVLSLETKLRFLSNLNLSSEAQEIFTAIALAAEVGPPHSRPWPFDMQVHMWRQLTDAVLEGDSGLQQLNREDYVLHSADLGMTVSPSVMGIDGVDVSTVLSSTDEGDDEVILDFDCYGDFNHLWLR